MSLAQLSQFLDHLGWEYDVVTSSLLRAQYKGVFGEIKVLLQLREAGLRVAINPVLERPKKSEVSGVWSNSVGKLVTALDKESPSIRIGFDREGDIYAKIDLPKQQINFDQFVYIMLNLCQVSEQLTVPVLQAQAYDEFDTAQA